MELLIPLTIIFIGPAIAAGIVVGFLMHSKYAKIVKSPLIAFLCSYIPLCLVFALLLYYK